jgi:hypothetical protein
MTDHVLGLEEDSTDDAGILEEDDPTEAMMVYHLLPPATKSTLNRIQLVFAGLDGPGSED